jgi:hypothetical protein
MEPCNHPSGLVFPAAAPGCPVSPASRPLRACLFTASLALLAAVPWAGAFEQCTPTCDAEVPKTAKVGVPVTFSGTAGKGTCTDIGFEWFPGYNLKGDITYCSTISCTKTFTEAGTSGWTFRVNGIKRDGTSIIGAGSCEKTGSITVTKDPETLRVPPSLTFTADTITHSADNLTHTLTGGVMANGVLLFSGPVTFHGDPASGRGGLTTGGTLSVATVPGPSVIVSGAGLTFQVDGAEATLTPQGVEPFVELGFKLNGVPVYLNTNPILIGDRFVLVKPWLFVGDGKSLYLAALTPLVRLGTGEQSTVHLFDQTVEDGTPGVVVSVQSLLYGGAGDTLQGLAKLSFPFLTFSDGRQWVEASLEVEQGCINTLGTLPANVAGATVTLGPGQRFGLDLSALAVTNICHPDLFAPIFSGSMTVGNRGIAKRFSIDDSMWLYEPMSAFTLLQGEPLFFYRPIQGAIGKLVGLDSGDVLLLGGSWGTGGLAAGGDVINGTLRSASYLTGGGAAWRSLGALTGTFTLSPACSCPDGGDDSCPIAQVALLGLYGNSPTVANATFTMGAGGQADGPSCRAVFLGDNVFSRLPLLAVAVELTCRNEEVNCVLGSNLVSRPTSRAASLQASAASARVERAVTLARGEELAIFAVKGSGATLPAIDLRTPAGTLITPATTAQLTGVTYTTDNDRKIALFSVAPAGAGTWVIGESNLPESDIEFTVLVPQPPPVTTVTAVKATDTSVSIAAKVSPPSGAITVSLYYSRTHDGMPEGEIAAELPATTGQIAATWDVASLPTGVYFVFAVTEDCVNPPVTTWALAPITRDFGGLAAPTDLRVRREGGTVTLTWTPSVSTAIVGYTVLYTGDPRQPGYPASAASPLPGGMTIDGLDATKNYRFCVVGYDLDGNLSPESTSVTIGSGALHRRIRD